MKIAKTYTLFINPMLNTATYGNRNTFGVRIEGATLGSIYDCTYSQLKKNLKLLVERGFHIRKSRRLDWEKLGVFSCCAKWVVSLF